MSKRSLFARTTLLATSLALSACALIHHDTAPAPFLTGDRVALAGDISVTAGTWPPAQWWTRYDDPQLDALIARAIASAPSISVARTRVAQAKSQVDLARAGTNLQVTALGAIDREHVSANGFLGPYAETIPELGTDGPWYTEGIVGLGGSLHIDLWGKDRATVAAAMGVQNAKLAEVSALELELSADVAQLYYGIQTNWAVIALLEQQQDVARFALEAHEASAKRGLESQNETELARAQLLALQRQLAASRAQTTQLREALRALIGAGPDELADLKPVALPQQAAGAPPALSYELLARRPDLQAMRWYVQASFSRIDAAKAAFYPSFDIRAFFGFNALHLSDLFLHSSQQINLIPGLYLPIFDGGRLNANLEGARTDSNTLILQYNQAVLDAVRDVAVTGNEAQTLDTERQLQAARLAAVQFTEQSVDAHYRRGLASRLAAMQARQPVLAEQIALTELDGRRIGQDIALTKALGGGYREAQQAELKPR